MEKIRKINIQSICITFTCIIIFSSIWNIIHGTNGYSYGIWVLELLGYLILTQFIDYLLCKIDFKTNIGYYLSESIVLYMVFMGAAYFFYWFSFSISNIVTMTIAFIGIYFLVAYHFKKLYQEEAETINKSLEKKQSDYKK